MTADLCGFVPYILIAGLMTFVCHQLLVLQATPFTPPRAGFTSGKPETRHITEPTLQATGHAEHVQLPKPAVHPLHPTKLLPAVLTPMTPTPVSSAL